MNRQIRGLTSIRKGLGKDDTPYLVSSNSIIASENVSGRVSGENLESFREAVFTNPEGSQSGGDSILPIRKGPIFVNLEGSYFCQSRGVLILANRRGLVFTNPVGYCFCRSGGVLFLSIRRGTVFVNPEWYCFC